MGSSHPGERLRFGRGRTARHANDLIEERFRCRPQSGNPIPKHVNDTLSDFRGLRPKRHKL